MLEKNINKYLDKKVLVLLLFFGGAMSSRRQVTLLNIPAIENLIMPFFWIFFFINTFILIKNVLLRKKSSYKMPKYWRAILVVIVLKYLIVFISHPNAFSPSSNLYGGQEGYYFNNIIRFITNFLLIAIIARRIDTFSKLRSSIIAFGMGCAIGPIISFLILPNLIGSRTSFANGIFFPGGFWNQSVIGFLSSGWLLIGNYHMEKRKFKKVLSIFLAIIMFIGGIAGLSRAILIATALSIIVYVISLKNIKNIFKTITIVVILFLIIQMKFNTISENLESRFNSSTELRNESRVTIWKDYIEDMPEYFIIGAPIEGNKIFSMTNQGPHSVILNWWSQIGIFGVMSFAWIIWGLKKSSINIYKNLSSEQGSTVNAWIVAYLSLALINETGFGELSFYMGMGIIFAWNNLAVFKGIHVNTLN